MRTIALDPDWWKDGTCCASCCDEQQDLDRSEGVLERVIGQHHTHILYRASWGRERGEREREPSRRLVAVHTHRSWRVCWRRRIKRARHRLYKHTQLLARVDRESRPTRILHWRRHQRNHNAQGFFFHVCDTVVVSFFPSFLLFFNLSFSFLIFMETSVFSLSRLTRRKKQK